MSKPKKEKKPRPEKYAEKVSLDMSFEQAIQHLANQANANVKTKQEQSETADESELVEA